MQFSESFCNPLMLLFGNEKDSGAALMMFVLGVSGSR
jgi:hypothetical protein